MIKLKDILSEIRIIKPINAEKTINLYKELLKGHVSLGPLWQKLSELNLLKSGSFEEDFIDIEKYEKENKNKLIQIYQILLDYKRHNL